MRRSSLLVAAAVLLLGVPAGARPASIAESLQGRLVQVQNGRLTAVAPPRTGYIAFYFGASWCAPCRALMPELRRRYARMRATDAPVEIVFVSDDADCRRMIDYVHAARMPWPVVACRDRARLAWLQRARGAALPGLVVYDATGTRVLSSWSVSGRSSPLSTLNELERLAAPNLR